MVWFKKELYSDLLICILNDEDIYSDETGKIIVKKNKRMDARIRCYNTRQWIVQYISNIRDVNKKLKIMKKGLEKDKNIFTDLYVNVQVKEKDRTCCFYREEICGRNTKEKEEIVKKIRESIENIEEVDNCEICYRINHEKKKFTNSIGSCKIYDYKVCGIMVGYMLKKNKYQGMYRAYGIDSIQCMINNIKVQINKDIEFSSKAIKIPSGRYTCVFSPEVTGMLVHECLGHFSEADNACSKREKDRWIVGKKIGKEFLNVVDDGNVKGSGYIPFDDEGVKARKTFIVKNGIINNYLTDIKSGIENDLELTGNGRAKSNKYNPIVRMTTTYMMGGKHTVDQILHSIDYGIYIEENLGAVIEKNVHLKVGRAYIIRNGKIKEPVIINEIIGKPFELISNIDMASNNIKMCNDVFGGCGKKDQTQLRVSYGGPYIRIKNVEIL